MMIIRTATAKGGKLTITTTGGTVITAKAGTREFNALIANLEQKNAGYYWQWDESTLAGKTI